jgi:hypothetical protein
VKLVGFVLDESRRGLRASCHSACLNLKVEAVKVRTGELVRINELYNISGG